MSEPTVSAQPGNPVDLTSLPEGWRYRDIGDVSKIFGRIGFRGYTVNDIVAEGQGAISLSPSNIKGGRLTLTKNTFISWEKWDESPEIKIENGDIILVKTGSTVGKAAIVRGLSVPATLNPQMVVFKRRRINETFLGYVVTSEEFQSQLAATAVGGALPTLSQKEVAGYRFACPDDPEEQQAIAEALSDANALIEGLERLIAKKRLIKQGAMQELLTGKRRTNGRAPEWDNHGNPIGWERSELSELANFITGPFGSTFHKSDYVRGGVPLINPSHIVSGQIIPDDEISISADMARKLSVFALRENDVVIGRRGEMGRCAVVNASSAGFLCGTGSMIVRPKDLSMAGLLQVILSSPAVVAEIEENSVGTTMINLNQSTLASLRVLLPSSPDERSDLAAVLADMDAEIQALEARLAKARQVKEGMMQNLLTGRIRVV